MDGRWGDKEEVGHRNSPSTEETQKRKLLIHDAEHANLRGRPSPLAWFSRVRRLPHPTHRIIDPTEGTTATRSFD
ncbi:hypothetical protein EVAR_54614_1 [Eumeta japonica]|uniref:Uncharacterized protein n=1 Tax=Eumeta variegata TaxID=151549 RepID=A0A4C1YHW8_EUMVA|nr:hypothetical protein EVAR_54614_1 [Eumeta japonica]